MLIGLWVTLTVTLQRTGRSDCNSNAQTPGGRATSACEGEAQTVGTLSRDGPSQRSHFLGFFDVRAKWAREEAVTLGNPPGGRATFSRARGPQSEPLSSPVYGGHLAGSGGRIPQQDSRSHASPAQDVPSVSWLFGPSCLQSCARHTRDRAWSAVWVAGGCPAPTPATQAKRVLKMHFMQMTESHLFLNEWESSQAHAAFARTALRIQRQGVNRFGRTGSPAGVRGGGFTGLRSGKRREPPPRPALSFQHLRSDESPEPSKPCALASPAPGGLLLLSPRHWLH